MTTTVGRQNSLAKSGQWETMWSDTIEQGDGIEDELVMDEVRFEENTARNATEDYEAFLVRNHLVSTEEELNAAVEEKKKLFHLYKTPKGRDAYLACMDRKECIAILRKRFFADNTKGTVTASVDKLCAWNNFFPNDPSFTRMTPLVFGLQKPALTKDETALRNLCLDFAIVLFRLIDKKTAFPGLFVASDEFIQEFIRVLGSREFVNILYTSCYQ